MTLTLDAFRGTSELTVMVSGANRPPKIALADAAPIEMVPGYISASPGITSSKPRVDDVHLTSGPSPCRARRRRASA
jgi:hypothetical protein